jgi:hypothetical protein
MIILSKHGVQIKPAQPVEDKKMSAAGSALSAKFFLKKFK